MSAFYQGSVARILNQRGEVVGGGFLVEAGRVATCAHVINLALNRDAEEAAMPNASIQVAVGAGRIDGGASLANRRAIGTVEMWYPTDFPGLQDVAVLKLSALVADHKPPPTLDVEQQLWDHPFRAFGFPAGSPDGKWITGRILAPQLSGWLQLEGLQETGGRIEPGFSGSPVLDATLNKVIGIVVASDRDAAQKVGYVIPWYMIMAAFTDSTTNSVLDAPLATKLEVAATPLAASFSDAGDRVAVADRLEYSVWDCHTKTVLLRHRPDPREVPDLSLQSPGDGGEVGIPTESLSNAHFALSPDGRLLAYGLGSVICVVDIATNTLTRRLPVEPVEREHLSDEQLRNFGIEDGIDTRLMSSAYAAWATVALSLSRDGQFLVSGHIDDTTRVWNLRTGFEVHRFSHDVGVGFLYGALPEYLNIPAADFGLPSPVMAVAWTRDGQRVASSAFDATLRLWDLRTGTEAARIAMITYSVVFATSGDRFLAIAGDEDASVCKWWYCDVGQGHEEFKYAMPRPLVAAVVDESAQAVAIADQDGTVVVLDAATLTEHARVVHAGVTSIALHTGTRRLATAAPDGVSLWSF